MPPSRTRSWIPIGILAFFTIAVFAWPAALIFTRAFTAAPVSGRLPAVFSPWLFVEGLAWAALIAVLATAIAWPGAWAVRRWGARAAPFIAGPLLLPPYLAYAGWNLLRAPDSWLGGLIERAAANGHRWVPITTGRFLAIVGLAIWAAPLAAFTVAITLRRVDDDLLDQLRLDAGRRTLRHRARLALPGLLAALLLITLLMLGSAVPLHLAQMPTWSVRLWAALDLMPPGDHWRLWIRSWPLLLTALLGVIAMQRIVRPASAPAGPPRAARTSAGSAAGAIIMPLVGVAIPLLLFAAHVRSTGSLLTFWRISGPAVLDGLVVAAAVGGVSMGLVVVVWAALTARPGSRWPARLVMMMAGAALLPGVLMGAAVAGAWEAVPAVRDTAAIAVLAHLARFAAVAALAGLWLHGSEATEEREIRAMDGAATPGGWFRACWPAHRGVIVGAGLAAAVLSFFEIESSVVVQPPYMENLSRQILGYLHFARTDEMSAAAVMLLTAGVVVATIAARLAARSVDPSRAGPVPPGRAIR